MKVSVRDYDKSGRFAILPDIYHSTLREKYEKLELSYQPTAQSKLNSVRQPGKAKLTARKTKKKYIKVKKDN